MAANSTTNQSIIDLNNQLLFMVGILILAIIVGFWVWVKAGMIRYEIAHQE